MAHEQDKLNQGSDADRAAPGGSDAEFFLDSRMDPGLAALLRKAADGELAYEEMVALRMYMDSNAMAEDRVEFERQLRAACRRTMSEVRAPDELRSRVRAMVDSSRASSVEDDHAPSGMPVVVRRVEMKSVEQGPYRYVGWIWKVRSGVAAAILLLVGFAGGRWLNDYAFVGSKGDVDSDRFVRADVAGYLSNQLATFNSSGDGDNIAAKVQFMSLQRAALLAQDWLQQRPQIPHEEESGVMFAGGTQATMPGAGRAFHFRYRVQKPDQPDKFQLVSVFVQQDRLEMPLERDTTYGVMGPIDTTIWVNRHDGLVYYLLAESRWAVRRTVLALGLPEASDVIKSMPEVDVKAN
ncbi:MAG: hypothetical protein SFY96_02275 [Planctomycetota bacterium]|nr:hypothetical protein [Planctomycetota bacterium]